MITIVHSGQSGVERGAYRAALAMGLPVTGYMPANGRDEFGTLPASIRSCLVACGALGFRQPVRANIAMATAALVIVPEVRQVRECAGIDNTLRAIRAARIPLKLCDPRTSVEEIVDWVRGLGPGSTRLMVHGPRETRWCEGEGVAWKVVATLAVH